MTSICYYASVSLPPSAAALTLLFQYVWVNVLLECVVERHLSTRSTVIAVAVVLVGTVFAAGMVSVMASSELPVGIFAAWALVGDVPSALVLFGAILVLAGIAIKQFAR